jgi:hypothetical protein
VGPIAGAQPGVQEAPGAAERKRHCGEAEEYRGHEQAAVTAGCNAARWRP